MLLFQMYMLVKRIHSFLDRVIMHERSPRRLALTVSLGVYIGISPFIGFHTIMTFLFGWLFALNLAVLFAVSFLIHNPWTTLPIYMFDHYVGQLFFGFFNMDGMQFDPTWVESCNLFLKTHTGISGLSLTAFLVGGNLLAVAASLIIYPFAMYIFEQYLSHKKCITVYEEVI